MLFSCVIPLSSFQAVYAAECHLINFSNNHIYSYDPCSPSCSSASTTAPVTPTPSPTPSQTPGPSPTPGLVGTKDAVASIYGGTHSKGAWVPTNDDQGVTPGYPRDDNGLGTDGNSLGTSINGKPTPAKAAKFASFAELSMGTALGHLPPKARLAITNPKTNKTVIAEKRDIGAGGPQHPVIDLWWETAKLIDFTDGIGTIKYTLVPDTTPLTPLDATAPVTTPPPTTSAAGCCTTATINQPVAPTTPGLQSGETNLHYVFRVLVADFSSIGQQANAKMIVSGIVGSLQVESGTISNSSLPNGRDLSPKVYNQQGSGAYGIAQWLGGRLSNLRQHEGSKSDTVEGQTDFLWYEITKGSELPFHAVQHLSSLTGSSDIAKVNEAAAIWEKDFERAGPGTIPARQQNARAVFGHKDFGGGTIAGIAGGTGSGGGSGSGDCGCPTPTGLKTIVLDPGHSGGDLNKTIEHAEGLTTIDNVGAPGEQAGVFETAKLVETALKKAGYNVIKTKQNVNDNVGLIKRAQIANDAHADLAVSIHYDKGFNWNDMAWVTPQTDTATPTEGTNRTHRTSGSNTKYFDQKPNHAELVRDSTKYATAIRDARSAAEGHAAQFHDLTFPNDGRPAYGNISIVQLFSNVPWVYNEVGAKDKFDANAYAKGLTEGIMKAVPITGAPSTGTTSGCPNTGPSGPNDYVNLAMSYAWPDYKVRIDFTPPYAASVRAAQKAHKYVGGIAYPGVDCGGFTTRVMQDSGFDPGYGGGGNTASQIAWMQGHPNMYQSLGLVTDPTLLRPGDIAIRHDADPNGTHHTFMWVGNAKDLGNHPNFHGNIASASLDTRAPVAGTPGSYYYIPTGTFHWFHPHK
ncbi:MAG TPA: phage tail tip lysozyme [Patescibacteria group bacterium]|nr:phage tail tip lysozyme [Patescibacteria group bacterium]